MRGEYYLNGHWVIEFTRATPIAGTMLYYQRGAEGDNIPETIIGRGPTTEPLVVEVPLNETFEENFGYAFNSPTNVCGGALAGHSRTNSQFKTWSVELFLPDNQPGAKPRRRLRVLPSSWTFPGGLLLEFWILVGLQPRVRLRSESQTNTQTNKPAWSF